MILYFVLFSRTYTLHFTEGFKKLYHTLTLGSPARVVRYYFPTPYTLIILSCSRTGPMSQEQFGGEKGMGKSELRRAWELAADSREA
jgi:hypothetical protein